MQINRDGDGEDEDAQAIGRSILRREVIPTKDGAAYGKWFFP